MEQSTITIKAEIPTDISIKQFVPTVVKKMVKEHVDTSVQINVSWSDPEQTKIGIAITGVATETKSRIEQILTQSGYRVAEMAA
jgi:hypothetical protein